MNYLQIAMLAGAGILALSVIPYQKLFGLMNESNDNEKVRTELVAIIEKWQDLKNICDSNGLSEASTKLDEIFPILNLHLINAEKKK